MEFRNKKTWQRDPVVGYFVAVGAYMVAFILRNLLKDILQDTLPTFFFTLAAVLVAAKYGAKPAFLTIALSLPTSLFFFVKPYGTFAEPTFRDTMLVLYFTSVTALVAVLMEMTHRGKYNSELNARVSDSRFRLLVQMDRDYPRQ